ncbi:MAG: hypothetical protein HOQ28_01225 [Thermoleophilia bacterium]|nr:hypothetical protein [Thermoleophilia bacterium]
MTVAAGLTLALLSAFALNWGWLEQHGAAQELPPLSLRRPLRSLRALFGDRAWFVGFAVGLAGWACYVAALALAPLSLVQATSAGGIGILAALAQRRGHAVEWRPVWLAVGGLALLGGSLAGGGVHGSNGSPWNVLVWLGVSAVLAGALVPVNLGLTAGTLYAAGDVATKAAVHHVAFVPLVLAAHGAAFVALQLGFQRGSPLATAGTSTLLTNALPIAAGIALFHERLPHGALGGVRVVAFTCVVVAAALLMRQPSATTRSATSTTLPAPRRNAASYGRPASPR